MLVGNTRLVEVGTEEDIAGHASVATFGSTAAALAARGIVPAETCSENRPTFAKDAVVVPQSATDACTVEEHLTQAATLRDNETFGNDVSSSAGVEKPVLPASVIAVLAVLNLSAAAPDAGPVRRNAVTFVPSTYRTVSEGSSVDESGVQEYASATHVEPTQGRQLVSAP